MLKMKFSNPSYALEKDGKTTVCIYYCEIYNTETKKTFCTFTAVGKSTCTENDTFDAKVGEKFAENHAKKFAYQHAIEFINLDDKKADHMVECINHMIDTVDFFDQMKHLLNVENKHFHKLLKTC